VAQSRETARQFFLFSPHNGSRLRRILSSITAIIVFFASGCGTKKISKNEIRAVTSEIVSAAQRISGHTSEMTIRPELQTSKIGAGGPSVTDNIYISLSDGSETNAIRKTLEEIADRHKLSMVETSSAGVARFDYAFDGVRTHTIHVVTPLTARTRAPAIHGRENARLAIIIDDLGYDRAAADALRSVSHSPFPFFHICHCHPRSRKKPIAEATK
jgi:hypothetical protein